MKKKVDRVIVAVLLVAALARLPGLGKRSLWFDEALSGLIARLSTTEVLTNAAGSSHPPGYYFLLHLWRPMGESEFALRFPSAWFSLLAVALVARLGRDLFDRRTARLAALGMAMSPFQVYYAQEARMYAFAIPLIAGVIWAFSQSVKQNYYRPWALYVLLTALGLYVHYYVALVVLALHLWLLLDWSRASTGLPSLLAADALIAIAFVPQLTQFLTESTEYLTGLTSWQPRPSLLSPLTTLYYLIFGHVLSLRMVGFGLFLLLSLVALVVFLPGRHGWGTPHLMMLILVGVPILIILGISLVVHPIYLERSFAVVTPALVLLLGAGVARAPVRSPTPYVAAALGCLMLSGTVLYHARPDPAKPPIREAVDLVVHQTQASDAVFHLQDASYIPALYYASGTAGSIMDAGQSLWLAQPIYRLLGGHTARPADLAVTDRAWLVLMPGYLDAPQAKLLEQWDDRCAPVETWSWERFGPGNRARASVQVRLCTAQPSE